VNDRSMPVSDAGANRSGAAIKTPL